VRKRR